MQCYLVRQTAKSGGEGFNCLEGAARPRLPSFLPSTTVILKIRRDNMPFIHDYNVKARELIPAGLRVRCWLGV